MRALGPDRHVVLVGGGHTHALTLLALRDSPLEGARITVISASRHSHYSGMLPGLIAGAYEPGDLEIDVESLATSLGATFLCGTVIGLDPVLRQVTMSGGQVVGYDLLSLNVGAAPDPSRIPGARDFAVPTRPFQTLVSAVRNLSSQTSVAIVGGGAAGVELAWALRARLGTSARLTLIDASNDVLPAFPRRARALARSELTAKAVDQRLGSAVVRVEKDGVHLKDGRVVTAQIVVWAGQASPPAWLTKTGLAVADDGSVRVAPTLRSVSHPDVFAVGDAAKVEGRKVPKAGVFAVREAPILTHNLRATIRGHKLKEFEPQRHALALLNYCDGRALFVRGPFVFQGRLVMRLKDWIDRAFIARFTPRRGPS